MVVPEGIVSTGPSVSRLNLWATWFGILLAQPDHIKFCEPVLGHLIWSGHRKLRSANLGGTRTFKT